MKTALLAVLGLTGFAEGGPSSEGDPEAGKTVYFFFSEKTRAAPEAARALVKASTLWKSDVALRPVLLVEEWKTFLKVDESAPLYRTVRELGKDFALQAFDEEGLRLASAWGITRLPAVVLVSGGRAHKVQGAGSALEGLFRCSR